MKTIYILLLLNILATSSDFENEFASMDAEMQKMEVEFEAVEFEQKTEFKTFAESIENEYNAYAKELGVHWEKPKLSTKKDWVSYSQDKQSRSEVDFEKNLITVEVIADSEEKAQEQMKKRLAYVVSKNTKEVVQTDPLQKRVAKIQDEQLARPTVMDAKPIISNVIFKKKPTKKDLIKYVDKTVEKSKINVRKSKDKHKNVYTMQVSLPKNSTLKRSKTYKNEIMKNAKRFDLPVPLVFAIMHTESNFNPFAKSHIPAYGLMQIVPRSAGKDIFRYLKKNSDMPTASYLYNSDNNIEAGTTYLHILYTRYLRKVKNPDSRLYCSIAAYNTGAGNIAWAFTGKNNMNRAAPKINAMTPDEVYNHLLENLKYDEPKHYLKRVKKRMSSYKKAYNL